MAHTNLVRGGEDREGWGGWEVWEDGRFGDGSWGDGSWGDGRLGGWELGGWELGGWEFIPTCNTKGPNLQQIDLVPLFRLTAFYQPIASSISKAVTLVFTSAPTAS